MIPSVEDRGRGGVIVADDEPLVRRLTSRVLENAGFQVVAVADGDAALQASERDEKGIRAVVLDLRMPPRGGAATLAELLRRRPGLGVVLTSGVAPEPAVSALLAQHKGVFLHKPFAPAALVRAVEQVLARGTEG